MYVWCMYDMIFFFNDTATTEIYTYGHTLSLHDALPIWWNCTPTMGARRCAMPMITPESDTAVTARSAGSDSGTTASEWRSEEHTSELQSLMRISYAVFCLKKKNHLTSKEQMHSNLKK